MRIDPGEARRWRIGPLSLTVARLRNEWRLGSTAGDDPLDTTLEVAAPATDDALAAAETVERFVTSGNTCRITLSPRLADRSVVVRPQIPLSVLPDDEARLFVSSPVFVAVVADGGERPLRELPTFRPSDTWFGSSTINGEVCYASRTACRLALDEVPFRPHRAVTAIRIRNRAGAPLLIERLCVPVPRLPLLAAADGNLWTPSLTMTRSDDEDGLAELDVGKSAPREAGATERLAAARVHGEHRVLRAFNSVF